MPVRRRAWWAGCAVVLGVWAGAPSATWARQAAPDAASPHINPTDMDTGDEAELQPPPLVVPPKPPAAPPPQFTARHMKLVALIDRNVIGPNKEQVGRVIDVLLDEDAHPAALIVDVGGFMGVGNRRIAIAWDMLEPASVGGADGLQIRMNSDDIRAAPAYAPDSTDVQVVQPPPPLPVHKDAPPPAPPVTVRAVPLAEAPPPAVPSALVPPAPPVVPDVPSPPVERPHAEAPPPAPGVPNHGLMSR